MDYLIKRIPYKKIDIGFDSSYDFSKDITSVLFTCRSYSIKVKKGPSLFEFIIIKGDKKDLFKITESYIEKEGYVMNKINNMLFSLAQ